MMMIFVVLFGLLLSGRSGVYAQEWQIATPESQGLSSEELTDAARRVNARIDSRVCFVAVKNGFIVHEEYYQGWAISDTREAYSTTKSQCSSLFGDIISLSLSPSFFLYMYC